ncbi:tetratricopeptide repeat protein [Sandaracinus amylolyticus]|uniref:Tetratricopeptide repeat protein n=1 Tax=Sandaracinus amylolyticus TaxID=927083 RepID=A0A0F6W0X2_9BACT|nr:tetratricopeptide repeat protein [Sandaracinus amylolyticus]AKF04611.1 hypothetical protein DB32_001760 [Sandaracinus amylolyticus]
MSHDEFDDALAAQLGLGLDDEPGPARRITPQQSAALIAGALDAWQGTPAANVSAPVRSAAPVRLAYLVAAISALIAVGSVAAMTIVLSRGPERSEEPVMVLPQESPRDEAIEEPVAPEPPPEPAIEAPPVVEEPEENERADAPARRRPAPRTPDDLLAEANALRSAGRWREAEATYARVPREHPDSFSAYVAQVAAGDVRLAHLRDPRGALRLYRRALAARPGGPLDAEAREGIARALRRLGDPRGERDTLRALISAHPTTPAATRARARLAELESSGE